MARVRNLDIGCVLHGVGRRLDQCRRRRAVFGAAENKRGHRQGECGRGEVRVADRRATAEITGQGGAREQVAPAGRGSRIVLAERGREPALHHTIGDAVDTVRRDRLDTVLPEAGFPDFRRCVHADEGIDPVRVPGGKVLSDHAPDGNTAKQEMVQSDMVDKELEVGAQVLNGVGRFCNIRQAVTALVVADNPADPVQLRQQGIPDPEIGTKRIGQNQRRAAPHRPVGIVNCP